MKEMYTEMYKEIYIERDVHKIAVSKLNLIKNKMHGK